MLPSDVHPNPPYSFSCFMQVMVTHCPGDPNQEPPSPKISIFQLQSSSNKPKKEADVLNPVEKQMICAAAVQRMEASGNTRLSRAGKQPRVSLHSFIFQLFWQPCRFLRRFQNISILSSGKECDTGTGEEGRSGWPQQSPVLHPWVQLKPVACARRHQQKCLRQVGIYQISFSCFFLKPSWKQGGKFADMCWVEPADLPHVCGWERKGHEHSSKSV